MTAVTHRGFLKGSGAVLALLLCGSRLLATAPRATRDKLPNIVLILSDNHSPSSLGCYGNKQVLTPHLDALAAEGTMFTRAFSCSPDCSPCRQRVDHRTATSKQRVTAISGQECDNTIRVNENTNHAVSWGIDSEWFWGS